jgi:hypothetical protein
MQESEIRCVLRAHRGGETEARTSCMMESVIVEAM